MRRGAGLAHRALPCFGSRAAIKQRFPDASIPRSLLTAAGQTSFFAWDTAAQGCGRAVAATSTRCRETFHPQCCDVCCHVQATHSWWCRARRSPRCTTATATSWGSSPRATCTSATRRTPRGTSTDAAGAPGTPTSGAPAGDDLLTEFAARLPSCTSAPSRCLLGSFKLL